MLKLWFSGRLNALMENFVCLGDRKKRTPGTHRIQLILITGIIIYE